MRKKIFLLLIVIFLVFPTILFAIEDPGLDETGGGIFGNADVSVFVGNVIKAVLTLLGVIVLVLMVYGGYLWMMSGGNEQMVKKAKDILINATIGLIIVIAAYAITTFVVGGIYSAINSSGSTSQCPTGTTYQCIDNVQQINCVEGSSPDCVCSCQ